MKSSKWQVVALGELQQPGGVGATQEYNPVTDGPNPDAALMDNAGNSPEQEVALQTWVNMAVDLLNRGEPQEAIIAKLAHDGCPNPQEVLQRAQQQPMDEKPVSDEIGQDPFETPPPQDGQTGQMEGLSQQPPVLGHIDIRIEGKDWSKWAADNLPGTDPEGHPVSEIEKFIASMPEVEPARPEIRINDILSARRAIRGVISKASYADALKLSALDQELDLEANELKVATADAGWLGQADFIAPDENGFRYNAYTVASPEMVAYSGNVREAARIWASEVAYTPGLDLTVGAVYEIERLGLNIDQANEFIAAATEVADHRHVRTQEFTAETPDNEGPAEELFT